MLINSTVKKLIPVPLRAPLRRMTNSATRRFSRSRLTNNQSELLDLVRRDNQAAAEPSRETTHWQHTNKELSFHFSSSGINNAPTQQFIHHYSTPVTGSSKWRQHAFHLLQSLVDTRDKWGVLDAITAHELKKNPQFDSFTWDHLISADALISLAEVDESILTKPTVVAEIGAGYGRMPEALFACNPQATYLIFDLPESLLISSSYLPVSHPETDIVDYPTQKGLPTISRDDLKPGQFWFCGSHDLEKLSPDTVDVFLSVYTFQEMQQFQVDAYFKLIDRTTSGYFYTAQKWKASLPTEFSGYDEYPFNPDWVTKFSRNSTYSSQYFETCFALRK
jgi:hypothetical protein